MDELSRIKWQCRRGTKELDLLLNRYLETGYVVADRRERALFLELLEMEDDVLMEILMENRKLIVKELTGLINKIAK